MKTPKFKIHRNRELGNKKFYTERDYKDAMKQAGVEHYDPSSIKKPTIPAYARSEWAMGMHKDIRDRNGRPPGDRFIKELEKRGYTKSRYEQAFKIAREK